MSGTSKFLVISYSNNGYNCCCRQEDEDFQFFETKEKAFNFVVECKSLTAYPSNDIHYSKFEVFEVALPLCDEFEQARLDGYYKGYCFKRAELKAEEQSKIKRYKMVEIVE